MLTLVSYHLPIIISIEKPPYFISRENHTFVNFNNVNSVNFTEFAGNTFTDCQFRKEMTAATAHFIYAGRIVEICTNFPAEAAVLASEPGRSL